MRLNHRRTVKALHSFAIRIEFATPSYRPAVQRAFGWLNEGRSAREGRVLKGTWAYHGFESVIWAQRES